MKTMNCSEVLAELPLFVGGDLEAPGRDDLARHLEGCGSCREALAAAAEARAVLVEHLERTASAPSASVWPALREELRAEGLVRPAGAPEPARAAGRLLRLVPAAAAAAAVLALALLRGGDAPGPAPAPAPLVRGEAAPAPERAGLEEVSPALAGARPAGGLREVAPSESLGGRAGLFVEEPLLPPAPFQSSHMRMASFGQEPSQQAPVLDAAQLLRIRGIR
jgi:hypothetical protein